MSSLVVVEQPHSLIESQPLLESMPQKSKLLVSMKVLLSLTMRYLSQTMTLKHLMISSNNKIKCSNKELISELQSLLLKQP